MFGAALGGVIAAAIGLSLCFACNAISFAAVLVSLLAMHKSELYPAKPIKRQPGGRSRWSGRHPRRSSVTSRLGRPH